MSYKDWTMAKKDFDEQEYIKVAEWCNTHGYHVEDGVDFYYTLPNVETNLQKIAKLKDLLFATDYVAAKIAEGSATREQYAEIIAKRQQWREEIRKLGE
ncbi:MAG: hypothetical protein IJ525_00805 [Alphaproteobacteria bacterium]|nr:hypothetical protein [Alphaproteobacteria bacterium]